MYEAAIVDLMTHELFRAFPVVPGMDESREDALERRCRDLKLRLTEQAHVLSEVAQELNAEIQRREAAQAALLQAQKLEALGFLISGVTHDFNNMLNAIAFGYEALAIGNENPRHQSIIDHGRHAVAHGTALTRRLLNFARREETKPQVLGSAILLNDVRDLVRQVLGTGRSVEVEADEDVWPVIVDRHELETTLLNLAANARDAMPEGGRLQLVARKSLPSESEAADLLPGDYVIFSVRDSGTGMPPEVLARATEAFFTTKGAEHGTGLGLAMASRFATRWGGTLRIETAPGQGTLVEIFLPRAPNEPPEAANSAGECHGGVILLADEREIPRIMTAGRLRRLGYRVVGAGNGKVALAHSYNAPVIDLAIVSTTLPEDDGTDLADRLHIERPALPILFLLDSGRTADTVTGTGLDRRISAAELEAAVNAALAERRSLEQRGSTLSARLMARLAVPELKERFAVWRQLRGCDALPHIDAVDTLIDGQRAHHFIAAADVGGELPRFRLVSVGNALTARLGRALDGECFAGSVTGIAGSLSAAYGRAARSRLPVYDWFRQSSEVGPPTRFDRLILPMSENGHTLSHLVGFVLFSNFPQSDHQKDA